MSEAIRPFSDEEYCVCVLSDLKRFLRKSDQGLQWVHPRHWSANDADRRQVMDALDLALECVRERIEQGQQKPW